MVEQAWAEYPGGGSIIVPVAAANRRSRRALEKAGPHLVAEGVLAPVNPMDDGRHVLCRTDRP